MLIGRTRSLTQLGIAWTDNTNMVATLTSDYLARIHEAHERSGLSLREVASICDLDHSYVSRTLNGERRPQRDVLISLCVFGWRQTQIETDEILLLAGLPPLGRSALREFRQSSHKAMADGATNISAVNQAESLSAPRTA